MADLLPDLNTAGAVRVNRKLLIGGAGVLASLLIGGIVYGLADGPTPQQKKREQDYDTSLNRSPEQERLESLPAIYEPETSPAPSTPSVPEPEPTPPPLTPQPGHLPGPPPEDPMKVAARQSAISFFNNADPRQSAGILSLLPKLPGQDDPSAPTEAPHGDDPSPSVRDRAAVPVGAGGTVNPFVTLATAAGPNSRPAAPSTAAPSYTVFPGTIIKAKLDTAIDTTHPSTARARVIETVFDHKRGLVPVIPQGTMLVGEPSSNTRYGQERVFISWTQMTFPDGRMLDLAGMSASDGAGRGGIEAEVDNHYPELFATAILTSLLSVGATVAGGDPEDPLTLQNRAAEGVGTSVSNTGTTLLGRAAAIPPTLTQDPGTLVTIIVNRPITVETQ